MQNKKLLSTLLVLVMICACAFGMLVTNAGAEMTAEPVEWDTDLATTIASIDGSAFDGTKYAEITIPAGEETAASVENGVLFGVETIFDSTGARLPIVIKGEDATATITFDEVSGDVSCSNSYTFQGLNFYVADAESQINFYAGSGEVVLDTVVLSADGTGKNAYFYADNAVASAFAGWTAPAEGELIATSLTLKNLDYTQASTALAANKVSAVGQIGVVGAAADFANAEVTEITAAMTSATLVIEDAKLGDVLVRSNSAKSPVAEVNLVINDSAASVSSTKADHNTQIYRLSGIGKISANENVTLPAFDYNATINGGYFTCMTVMQRGTNYDGDLSLEINAGYFAQDFYAAHADGYISGTAVVNLNGGKFAKTFYGPNTSRGILPEGQEDILKQEEVGNLVTIDGAEMKTYQGNRVAGSVVTTVNSGTIDVYYGSYCTAGGGGTYDFVVNNINGGTIGSFRGSGLSNSVEESGKKVTIGEGEEATEVAELVPARAGYTVTNLINNFNGGTVTGITYGAGMPNKVVNLTNNYNGTVFTKEVFGVWCTMYQIHDGSYVLGATNVTGTLTNNFAHGKVGATYFKDDCFFMAGEIAADVTVNMADFNETYADATSKTTAIAQFTFYSAPAVHGADGEYTYDGAAIKNVTPVVDWKDNVIKGDYTYNFNGMRTANQVELVEKVTVKGKTDINLKNGYSGSHLTLNLANCEGGLDINVDDWKHSVSSKYRHLVLTKAEVGGDYNVTLKSLVCSANTDFCISGSTISNGVVCAPVHQDGDVSVTFAGGCDFANDLAIMNLFEVDGTYTVTYEGTNTFDHGYITNTARVGKLVNNIAGTITGNFFAAGAPVGTWVEVPAAEEGAEPTLEFVPGEIENNILPGASISGGAFFGSGEEEVKSVTNTMTGGKINGIAGNSAAMLSSVGCYFGNYGPVTDKVVNNIYSGSIGNNVYGSNGDLTCPVYTNIGNNLYAELYPEAEALTLPSTGRICFAGGRYYTNETRDVLVQDTDAEGNPLFEADGVTPVYKQATDEEGNPLFEADGVTPVYETTTETYKAYAFDAETGSTGPVYVNVDGAKLAMIDMLYGPVVAADANGDAANVTIKNTNATTHAYFNMNDDVAIPGNVNLTYDNFALTADSRHYYGPSNVGGDLTINATDFSVNGTAFLTIGDVGGNLTMNLKNVSAAKDLVTTIRTNQLHEVSSGSTSEYKANADTFLTIGGDFSIYAEDVTFGNAPSISYRDVEGSNASSDVMGSITGKYVRCTFLNSSIHFTNRGPQSGHAINEFDSCSFGGLKSSTAIRIAMQGTKDNSAAKKVFIYGNTVVGENTNLELGRQNNQSIYLGAKPDASYNPVPADTTLNVAETGAVWGVCREANTDGSYKHRLNTSFTYIYDIAVEGSGLIAPLPDVDTETPGHQIPEDMVAALVLVGNIEIGETSPAIYINGADSNGTVSAENGNWIVDKVYLTAVGGADIANISSAACTSVTGYGKKVENSIVGAEISFTGEMAVSMDVSERIVLNLWISRADIEAYLATGMLNSKGTTDYEYNAVIILDDGESLVLGKGYISAEDLATQDGELFKVTLGAVSANNFDNHLIIEGNSFWVAYDEESNNLNILSIAEAGMNGDYTADEINLFKAIYNYGASVCDGYEMVAMEGFVQTGAAAPVYQKGSAEDIQFTSMSLLMGDAIGIRFKGNVIDAATVVTMTVNGEEVTCFNYDEEAGTVDAYVNMESVNDELTFIIYTDGAPAIAVKTSIKGYTEAVMNNGAAELAVAQLAQACANILA